MEGERDTKERKIKSMPQNLNLPFLNNHSAPFEDNHFIRPVFQYKIQKKFKKFLYIYSHTKEFHKQKYGILNNTIRERFN